jgi:hypothetical protein
VSLSADDRAKLDALVRRALDTSGASEEERRTAAIIALQTAARLGVALFNDARVRELEGTVATLRAHVRAAGDAAMAWRERAEVAVSQREELAHQVDELLERLERGELADVLEEVRGEARSEARAAEEDSDDEEDSTTEYERWRAGCWEISRRAR